METAIYITSVLITILWSVWNYRLWTTKAQLREESIFRFVLIMGPSAYLLVCLLAGWRGGAGLRLDLLGIIVLDIVMLFCSLLLGIGQITTARYSGATFPLPYPRNLERPKGAGVLSAKLFFSTAAVFPQSVCVNSASAIRASAIRASAIRVRRTLRELSFGGPRSASFA